MTGMTGPEPAMTALTAIFSPRGRPSRGARPDDLLPRPPEATTNRLHRSGVGGMIGSPSVQRHDVEKVDNALEAVGHLHLLGRERHHRAPVKASRGLVEQTSRERIALIGAQRSQLIGNRHARELRQARGVRLPGRDGLEGPRAEQDGRDLAPTPARCCRGHSTTCTTLNTRARRAPPGPSRQ